MTARAGFTIVGQVAGAFVGGPIGAAIGGMVGGMIGGAIDGPTRNTQALLDDLGAIKFDYGSTWPRIYGSYRVKVAPIWSSTKRPVAHDEAVDSKGGPDQINRTFTYEQDWLCWAPLNATGWARIWINGKLRASRRADADDGTIEASGATPAWADVTFYDGAADQLPWPVYEAAVGTADACAYRHRPTICFASLDLGTGGQPPLIEIEFVSGSSVIEPGTTTQFANDVAVSDFPPGGSMRPMGAIAFGSPTRIPTFAAKVDLEMSLPPPCCALDPEGHPIWSPPDVPSIKCWDVNSLGEATQVSEDLIPEGYGTYPGRGTGNRALVAIATRSALPISVALVGDGASAEYALPDEDNWLGDTELRFATWGASVAIGTTLAVGARPEGITGTYVGNRGNIYICTDAGAHVATVPAALAIEALALNGSTVWALSGGNVYPFTIATLAAGDAFACAGSSIFVDSIGELCYVLGSAVYRRNADEWVLLGTMTGPVDTTHAFGVSGAKLYAATGDIQDTYLPLYTIRAFSGSWPRLDLAAKAYADYWFNSFYTASYTQRATRNECYCVAETTTGPGAAKSWIATYWCERLYGYSGDTTGEFDTPLDDWVWDPATASVYIDLSLTESSVDLYVHDLFSQPFASVVTPEAVPLADIVQAESLLEWTGEAGALGAGDLDVSALAGIEVTGFLASSSPREVVAQLADVFYFGAVCSDKLYMRLRGGASVATVPAADTGAGVGQAGEVFAGLERGNDLEQAIQVAVTGPNLLADYEPGTENSDRLTGESVELRRYATAVVFTPAERKGRADTMVLDGRVASHTGQVALDDAYMALEPCDVWLQFDDEGNAYRVRAERENYADGVRTFDVVLDDATVLSSSGITVERDTRALQLQAVSATEALLIDAPLVRDADDARGFYAVARRANTAKRWSGYSLFKSVDGVSYASVASSSQSGVFGSCSVVPGAWSGPRVFNERDAIVVNVGAGTLASSTRDALLNDASINAFAIGAHGRWLFGQFRDATLVSAGVYRLTGLLLGAHGTEQHIGTQIVGDSFALLRYADGMVRVATDATDQAATRYYKPVTVGQALSAATPQTFVEQEVGKMPLSPVDARAMRDSGDITLAWQRRTRLQVRMIGPAGILVPLGEESEAYSIDVYDDDTFTTVVRTLASSTPSVAYSAADQTTDFGSPQAAVSFAIHQISAAVGRGFALRATL